MKRIFSQTDRFHTLIKVMDEYPAAFEGSSEMADARDTFKSSNERIAELIALLNKPVAEYYGLKRDSRDRLRSALRLAIGTGIAVALRQQNAPVEQALRRYKLVLSRTAQHDLPEMARRVYDELKQNETVALQAGLKAGKLAELQQLTSNFRDISEATDYQMNDRRSSRTELQALVSGCNRILRDQLDTFVMHCKDDHPGFYNAYMAMRKPVRRKRRTTAAAGATAEISGTVTHSLTGLPVAGATVSLQGFETAFTTDADGYYLAEELEAGNYTVQCYAPGFGVPQPYTGSLAAGDSLVIDFTLAPADPQQN